MASPPASSTLELVEDAALAARAALPTLLDERVAAALHRAAELVDSRADAVLAANADDVARAKDLDAGALDRLLLDDKRLRAIARGLGATAALDPIERDVHSWRL